jgi:hypothetical protein
MRYATVQDVKPAKPKPSLRLWLPENQNVIVKPDLDVAYTNAKVLSNKVKKLDKSALFAFLKKDPVIKRRKKEEENLDENLDTATTAIASSKAIAVEKEEEVDIE